MLTNKMKRLVRHIARQGRHCGVRQDYLAEREALVTRIRERQEDGYVYLVSGGRDCDGVQWEGMKTLVKAVPRQIEQRMDVALEWADGPMHFSILSPTDGEEVRYTSRDLGMEAFENGHNHVIYV